MDAFPGDEVLQEASIEALAVLGGAGKKTPGYAGAGKNLRVGRGQYDHLSVPGG